MKTLILFSLISLPALAEVTLQDCQDDALLYGNHKTSVQPLAECATLVRNDAASVSVTGSNNRYKAFGQGNMVYVESYDENAVLVDRTLLAGDQSELVAVKKIFIDIVQKRLLIVQLKNSQYELMVHDLDFIGNVSPLKVMRSAVFNGATSVKFDGAEEIEVINASGTYVIKADGESRTELSSKKVLEISPK